MDSYTVKPVILKSYFKSREAWYKEAHLVGKYDMLLHAAVFAQARRAAEVEKEKKEWAEI